MKKNSTHTSSGKTTGRNALMVIYVLLLMTISSSVYGGVVSGTFTTLTNCPMNLTCFTVDPTTGYFYGQGDQGSTNYYRYNAGTNTWTTLASCPQASGNNGGATYLNGKIYNSYCSYNVITVYDIASNTWTTISNGLNSGNISNDGTDIYVSANNTFKKYVISSGTWVPLTGTSCQPWGGLQYKNGFFYLHVGNGQSGFKKYEVATDTWTVLTNVPGGAVLGSAIYDAYYYCQGSYGGTNLYSYDLGAAEWNNTLTLPFSTDDAAIVTYGTSLYIVQGEAGTGFTRFTPNNPMLTNIEGTSLAYNIGDAAATVTSTINASQNSGTNWQSVTISVSANFQSGKDILSFADANGITGSWNSSTGELTLTGTTTIANYQTALRSVKYSNTDLTSTNATRTISFKAFDGTQYSNTAKRKIYFPGVPILTSTTAVSSITPTTASSGGFVSEDGGSSVTARGVCWSTTSGPTVTDSKTIDGSGLGSFASSLTGLTSGVTYYVRAYATNSTGTGYGNERTFTTIGPSITVSTASLSGFTACFGGASSSSQSFTVSGVYLSANIVVTAPEQYEVSTSSGSGYDESVSLIPSGGTVSNTTIYVKLLSTAAGTVTGNIAVSSTNATSKSVALSGTVSPLAVGGSISGSSPVIYGSSSGTMTLSGHSGIIKRWEKKLGSGTWTTIVSTSTTYSETPTSAGIWYYRAVIGSGSCSDVTSAEFALTVSPKPLTVTGASVTSKVYTGTTSATITGGTLAGIVGGDVVTVGNNTIGTFAQADAGTDISVSSSMTLGGANSSNYTIIQPTLSGSITKATLTVTAEAKTKVYGNANPVLTFAYSGFVNSDNASQIETEPSVSTTVDALTSVGVYSNSITLTGGSDNNYDFSYVPADFTVTRAMLTVTADNKTRVYGESNPAFTEQYSGFVNGDDESMINVKPVSVTAALSSSNTGDYAIVSSGASDDNYDFSYIAGTLTVTKAIITVTAENKNKIYGEENPTLTFSYSGFVLGDDPSVLDVEPVISTTVIQSSDAGSYNIIVSNGSDNNYLFNYVDGTFLVDKAVLTASADNKSKIYGEVNPPLTITYSGFVNSDNVSDIVEPSVSTMASVSSSTGTYPIVLKENANKNYSLVLNEGVMKVNKATLSVLAENKVKKYGDIMPPLSIAYVGFVGADDRTVLDLQPSISTTGSQFSVPGSYEINVEGGLDNNYLFNYTDATLTINKADLIFAAENKSRDYLGADPVLTYKIYGLLNGETESVLDIKPVIGITTTQNSNAGNYPITLSGGSDNCYNYIFQPGTLTIAKIPQSITFSNLQEKMLMKDVIQMSATSTSGLTVQFESLDNQIATVSGNECTGLSRGTVQIRAFNPGDQNYLAADALASIEIGTTHKDILHLFTPNNDGFNDTWEIPELSTYGVCDVRIFNRWGKLVYANKNYDNLWDGTSNGDPLPDGAYYFIIKTQNSGTISGTVNIVR